MNTEDKKTLRVAIFLGLIVSISGLAIIWNIFLNKGSVSIDAQSPYTVEIFGEKTVQCNQNICKIGSTTGEKTLILSKEGYKSIVEDMNFPLWRTNKVVINFEIIPYIKEVSKIPQEDPQIQYQIVKDEGAPYYKLISDKSLKAISYFPSKINNPQIFGNKNAAFVVDTIMNTGYKVDIDLNSREFIDVKLPNIKSGKLSDDKNHLIFIEDETNKYWLLDMQNSSLLDMGLTQSNTAFAWMGNQLILATKLGVQTDSLNNSVIVDSESETGINILKYDAQSKNITFLTRIEETNNLPTVIIPTTNQQIVYFTLDDKNSALFIK